MWPPGDCFNGATAPRATRKHPKMHNSESLKRHTCKLNIDYVQTLLAGATLHAPKRPIHATGYLANAPAQGRQVSGRGLECLAQAVKQAHAHLAVLSQHGLDNLMQQEQALLPTNSTQWAKAAYASSCCAPGLSRLHPQAQQSLFRIGLISATAVRGSTPGQCICHG